MTLPIDQHLDDIMALLDHHQVVIVEAATGTGKTTRIGPAWLAANTSGMVYMTQTRRNAVRWNGRRIASELGCKPGELVGWRLHGETSVTSARTRMILTMDQSMVNQIRRDGKLPSGLLIIDEAHERTVTIDLALGLVKQYLSVSPGTKVIITSATIDTEKFSRFFDGAPVVSVKGRVYPVSTEVLRMERFEHHSQCAARAARLVLWRFLDGKLEIPTEDGNGTQCVSSGTVIVLLPGKEDIKQTMESIAREAKLAEASDRVQMMACHSQSTPDEQDAIQVSMPEGVIRFVCGTEVLRNSVTVQHTIGVIDSLELKRLIVTPPGVVHLTKITVSQAESDQAKGRIRTGPGFYIAVSFDREYEMLTLYPQPAILREPITHVVLQVAAMGLDVRTFPFMDRPTESHIEAAIRRLRRVGALDEREEITEIGRTLLQFPIDPERAKALLVGWDLSVMPEVVIVSAVLSVEGIFHRPRDRAARVSVDETVARQALSWVERVSWGWIPRIVPCSPDEVNLSDLPAWAERNGSMVDLDCGHPTFPYREGARWVADQIRQHWAGDSQSDFVAIVRAYRAFKAEERRLQQAETRRQESGARHGPSRETRLRDWCIRHSVDFKRLRMAERVMREIREELENSPLGSVNGLAYEREFDAGMLTVALASGMLDNLATYDANYDQYRGPIGVFSVGHSSVAGGAALVLVGGVSKIRTGRRGSVLYLADLAAAVDQPQLVAAIPEMVEVRTGLNPRYDLNLDQVVSITETWFNGQRTGSREVPDPNHAQAIQLRCEGRNTRQWQRWTAKPEIVLPDLTDPTTVIPEIVVCAYGSDDLTRDPLWAYGTVTPRYNRTSSDEPPFSVIWTLDRAEAEQNRSAAVARLASLWAKPAVANSGHRDTPVHVSPEALRALAERFSPRDR